MYTPHSRRHSALRLSCAAAIAIASPNARAHAQSNSLDRLQVHGFLNQGIARADSLTVYGIGRTLSTAHRSMALLLSYAASPNGDVTIELANRKVGTNPVGDGNQPSLAWAYYRHRLHGTNVTIGRLPLPSGIFNETRNVGVLLPFFRAPGSFLPEGYESLDGASVRHSTSLGAWEADLTAFYGGMDVRTPLFVPQTQQLAAATLRVDRVYGSQLWINTPVQGVRFGFNGLRSEYRPGVSLPAYFSTVWVQSAEAVFDRAVLRAEHTTNNTNGVQSHRAWYTQGSVRIRGGVWADAQHESRDEQSTRMIAAVRENTFGVRWVVSPQLLFRAEAHDRTGYTFDQVVNPNGPAGRTRYGILSVSTSF